MSLTDLLDRISSRQKKREQHQRSDYRALVAQIADGKEPQPDVVAATLADNGKTIEDLRASVELLVRRRGLRNSYDQLPRINHERADIEKQITEANREFEAAEQRHEEVTGPLFARIAQLKRETSDAERARTDLYNTCADQDLLEQNRQVQADIQTAHNRRSELDAQCSSFRDWISTNLRNAEFSSQTRATEMQENAARLEVRRKQNEAEIEELNRKIADLQKREAAIRELMLEP